MSPVISQRRLNSSYTTLKLTIPLQDAYSLYHQQHESPSTTSTTSSTALPALAHAIAGSTGSAISNLAIYPLDLIITRLQVQRQLRTTSSVPSSNEYTSVLDAAQKIYDDGGISAFYTGVLQDTGKSVADSFLFFLFYNYLREKRLTRKGAAASTLPALDELLVGALAGAGSKFFTTPLANIVTRKQTASLISARSSGSSALPSARAIAAQIRAEKGVQGFWSGYSASIILTLNPSITFFLFETFKRSLLPRSQREHPSASATFLLAAISKAIASTVTYPFSLAKARAQSSSAPPVERSAAEAVASEVKNVETTDEAKNAGRDAGRTAARSTVFDTILRIYRQEGLAALYEGVGGEILKGFLGHGITMLLKEEIHRWIIKLYFWLANAVQKMRSPRQVAGDVSEKIAGTAQNVYSTTTAKAQDVGEKVVAQSQESYAAVKETVANVANSAGNQLNSTAEASKDAASDASVYGKQQAGHLLGNAAEQIGTATNGGKVQAADASVLGKQQAGHLLGNAAEQIGNATNGGKELVTDKAGAAKEATVYGKQQAGHLLGNAAEQIGKATEEAGKAMRPNREE